MTLILPKGLTLTRPAGSWEITPTFTWNESVWNPSMIATALWLDAADSGTITSSSNLVSQWNDKSGNRRNATSSETARPTYSATGLNSKPAVLSTRSPATRMIPPAFSVGSQIHIIAVMTAANSGTYQYLYGGGPATLTGMGVLPRAGATSGDWINGDALSFGLGSPSGAAPRSIGPISWTGPSLFYSALGATVSTTELNTTRVSTRVETTSASEISNTAPALFAPSATANTQNLEGSLSEFVMTVGTLSSTNKQKLEGYLAHKWGLTANLPSDHPYKTVGPTP